MAAISDQLLAAGCAAHIEALHGETVTIRSGADNGKTFTAVNEIESDLTLDTELGEDLRGKRLLRFRVVPGAALPSLASQDIVETADGQKWNAVRRPGNNFLTVDYELREIVAGQDT